MSAAREGAPERPGAGEDLGPALVGSLCRSCRSLRVIRSGRGSVFFLCERAQDDPRFPRYPPQPVIRCTGHEGQPPAE